MVALGRRLVRDRRGQALVEYVLLIAVVAVVLTGVLRMLGVQVGATALYVAGRLENAAHGWNHGASGGEGSEQGAPAGPPKDRCRTPGSQGTAPGQC